MDNIEVYTSELIITSSLSDLRAAGEQLNKQEFIDIAEDLISGDIDKECPSVAVRVRAFGNHLATFRDARAFFVRPKSALSLYCEATGLNVTAVREKLRPETQLEFNTKLAQVAVKEYMDYRRSYVNKRKTD